MHLRGTEYWPDFRGNILFWESCEGNMGPEYGQELEFIDSYLTDLELSNMFNEISGMVVGIPYGYNNDETEKLKKLIMEKTSDYKFPILFNVNIGHCDPIITVPIGASVKMDSSNNDFCFLESAVK